MPKIVVVDDYPYEVNMTGNGAPTWVFFHGFMGTRADFELIKPNGTCITINLMGFGPQAPIVTPPTLFHMEQQAASLAKLFVKLALPPVNLVGYSMGGRLALSLALNYPKLVNHLILEGATAGLDDTLARNERITADNLKADKIETQGLAEFVAAWEALPMFASQKLLPLAQQQFMHNQRVNHQAVNVANSLRYMGTGAQPNYWPKLDQLKVPVTLLVGEHDAKFQIIAQKLSVKIPQSRLMIVSGVGHNIHFEAPQKFSEALNVITN